MIVTSDQFATIEAAASDGYQCRLVSGVVRIKPLPSQATITLTQAQDAAYLQIDGAAETARSAFLTEGSGQALEYEATSQDAERALAVIAANSAATLTAADYPWLAAEQSAQAAVGVTLSLLQVAQLVHAQMTAWATAGAEIKRIRRTAKLEVAAATTIATAHAIVAALIWPAPPP